MAAPTDTTDNLIYIIRIIRGRETPRHPCNTMITINILPQKDKKELKLLNAYITIKNIVFILLLGVIGVIFISTTLLMAKVVLQNHFNTTIVNQNYLTASLRRFSTDEVRSFNQLLSTITEIQLDYKEWSKVLLNINSIINNGMTIKNINLNKNGKMILVGVAQTRKNLIDFRDDVNNSGFFENFDIPLESLFDKNDITFTFNLQMAAEIEN